MSGDVPADLEPAIWRPRLSTQWLGRADDGIVVLGTCPSTNDVAAGLAREGRGHGTVVVADAQSGGRGRMRRVWHSPARANLYVSLLLRPACAPLDLPPLTLMTGVAMAEALVAVAPELRPRLKWPNDVLLACPSGRRKVCGILTEMASDTEHVRHVVVGIGINVNEASFPSELEQKATSLRLVRGREVARADILCALLESFEATYDRVFSAGAAAGDEVAQRWRAFGVLGEPCVVERDAGRIEGVSVDIDRDGALEVRGHDGRLHRIVSGELS